MKFLSRILAININRIRYCSSFTLEKLVSEENIARTISNLKKIKPMSSSLKPPASRAAVLIPICVVDGKTSLLYTLRTSHLSSHKGQVSFPGGKHDPNDGTLENTAIRETREELGIDPNKIQIWGSGNYLVTHETHVTPVIGYITTPLNLNTLNINRYEVEEVFSVSFETLCDATKNGYTQFNNSYSTPLFLGGQRRIWGLTAVITHIFLKSFLPSNIYLHKIKFIQPFKINEQKYKSGAT